MYTIDSYKIKNEYQTYTYDQAVMIKKNFKQ